MVFVREKGGCTRIMKFSATTILYRYLWPIRMQSNGSESSAERDLSRKLIRRGAVPISHGWNEKGSSIFDADLHAFSFKIKKKADPPISVGDRGIMREVGVVSIGRRCSARLDRDWDVWSLANNYSVPTFTAHNRPVRSARVSVKCLRCIVKVYIGRAVHCDRAWVAKNIQRAVRFV